MWSKILTLVAVVAAAVPSSTIGIRNMNRPIRNLYKLFHHNDVFSDDILNGRLRQGLREEIGRLLGNELYTKNTQIVTKMSFGRIEADIRSKSVDITADVLVRISDSNCRRKRGILERQLQHPIEANGLEGPKEAEGPRDHKHAEGNHPGHPEHSKREEKDSHHSKHTENHSKHPEHSKHPGHPHHSKHPEHPHSKHTEHPHHSKHPQHPHHSKHPEHSHHSKHPEHCRATHKNEAECYLTYREHSSRSLLELRHHESQYSIHNVYCRLLGDSSEHHSHSEHHGKHDHSHHTHSKHHKEQSHHSHSKHHKEQSHHSQSKHEKHDHPHSKKEHKHEQSHSNLIPHSRHEEKKHHSKIEEHGQEKDKHHAQLKKDAESLHSDPKRQLRNDGAGRQMRAPPFNPFRI